MHVAALETYKYTERHSPENIKLPDLLSTVIKRRWTPWAPSLFAYKQINNHIDSSTIYLAF